MRIRGRKAFWRYLFSYFLIFLIPFGLFLFVFQGYFIGLYRDEVEANLRQDCSQAGSSLDLQLRQIENIASQIRTSSQFSAAYAETPVNQIQMYQQLHMLQAANAFLYDINYYQKNLDTVISSRCVMQRGSIDRYHFRYQYWPLSIMLADMDRVSAVQYRPFEPMLSLNRAELEIMTVNIPLSMPKDYNFQALQFQIEKSDFEKALGLSRSSALFVILDQEGSPVYTSEGVPSSCLTLARSILAAGGESTQENREFIAFGQQSHVNGWTYITMMPVGEAMSKSNLLRTVCYLYAGIMLLCCLLIIWWMTKRNYRPIQQLSEIARQYTPPTAAEDGLDEIEKAQLAISYLHELEYTMQEKLALSSAQIREGLLRKLLHGEYNSIAQFNLDGRSCQLAYSSPFLFVVAVSNAGEFSPASIARMEQYLSVSCEAYGIRLFQAGHSVLICGVESSLQKELLPVFETLSATLAEKEGLELWFGISTPTSDPSLLYTKYVEAVFALEYMGKGESAVLYSSGSMPDGLRYPSEEVETLRRFALDKDEPRFLRVYQVLLSYIENLKVSLFMRICVSYDVINTMVKILMELQGEQAAQKFFSENSLIAIEKSGDFSNYIQLIKSLRDQICSILERGEEKDALLEQIKGYVEAHYLEPDFNVQSIADRFNMNLPSMSAYFKGKTDVTLLQYITEYKMGYAMGLLRTTSLPLADISQKTGYSTPSSFIRKFRQYTGMTPGEYKKIHQAVSGASEEDDG